MIAKISVWVDKFVPGWSGEEGEPPLTHPVKPLVDAMLAKYETDAHFVPYRLVSDEGEEGEDCPRLKVETLPHLPAYGVRVVFDVAVADIDYEGAHKGNSKEVPQAWRDDMWQRAEATCPGALLYQTRGGMRIIAALPHPMAVKEYQAWCKRFRAFLRDAGLAVDEIIAWAQPYRLCYVTRDGVAQEGKAIIREPAVLHLPDAKAQVAAAAGVFVPGPVDTKAPFKLPRKILEGTRHQTLVRYGAQLRWQGLDEAKIAAQLQQVNERRCQPPAAADEIAAIAAWAAQQEDGQQIRQQAAGYRPPPAAVVAARPIPVAAVAAPAQQPAAPAPQARPALAAVPGAIAEDDGDGDDRGGRAAPFALGDHTEIARRVVDSLSKGSPVAMVSDLGEIWRYDPKVGYWRAIENHLIELLVHSYSGMDVRAIQANGQAQWRPLKINDNTVVGVVKSVHRLLAKPKFFAEAPAGTALADCWVRVTERGLERLPHAPEQRSTFGYGFAWTDEEPDCFVDMMRDYWGHKPDFEDKSRTMLEFIGASLCKMAAKFQKCMLFVGGGQNGKSSMSTVVIGVFPENTVTSVSAQQFGHESYRAMLASARLNVVGELPERRIKQEAAAALKALVSGDEVVARHLYKDPFRFKPQAGHLLSCNSLPDVEDDSDGFFRRFILFLFDKKFEPTGENRSVGDMVLEEDRHRIVCAALRALPGLVKRGRYVETKESIDEVTAWRNGQDEISLFLEDCTQPCEASRGNGTDGEVLYTRYSVWAPQNGYEKRNKNQFLAAVDKRRKRFYDNLRARRMYPVQMLA